MYSVVQLKRRWKHVLALGMLLGAITQFCGAVSVLGYSE